ncbi:MAG: putative O-glycosylation ligase, exosortase A system-associated [Burkholderiaceae bacterium]
MRDIALAAIVVVLLVWALARPWIGVLTWTWIGLMNPHRLTYGFMFAFPTAAAVAAVTLLGLLITKERKAPPLTAPVIWLTLLTLHMNFTMFFAWSPAAAWMQWDKVMKILLFTYVTMVLIYGREKIRWLMIVTAGSIGFYGAKGGVFTLLNGGEYRIWGPDGTFIDGNNEIGLAMIMVWPLIVVLASDPSKWIRRPFLAMAWLTPLSVVFTYSRGALLGLAAVAAPMLLTARRKWLALLLLIPVGLFAVWFAPQQLLDRAETIQTYKQDESSMQRLQAWGVAWNVAKSYPLTGAGFNLENVGNERWLSYASFLGEWGNRARAAHSIYFQMLGDHGFVGLGLFLGLLLSCLLALTRVRRQASLIEGAQWLAAYANGLRLGLVGFAVSGAFLSLAYFDLFYVFVAATAVLQRELRELVRQPRDAMPAMMLAEAGASRRLLQ